MNEQQFLEMDDRERDAWIDEFIVGSASIRALEEREWKDLTVRERLLLYTGCPLPKYSTDYNAMMRLVDSIEYRNFVLEKENRFGGGDEWWACFIIDPEAEATWHTGLHENRLLAVYLAAGRAKGVIE